MAQPTKHFLPERDAVQAQPQRSADPAYEPKPLKEILEENRKRAEEQWNDEHRFRGPKTLDAEEIDWMKAKEDEKRLKYLERELEELGELQQFSKQQSERRQDQTCV